MVKQILRHHMITITKINNCNAINKLMITSKISGLGFRGPAYNLKISSILQTKSSDLDIRLTLLEGS